jgi:hypothetical protein
MDSTTGPPRWQLRGNPSNDAMSINVGDDDQGLRLPSGPGFDSHFVYPTPFQPHIALPQMAPAVPARLSTLPCPINFTGSVNSSPSPSPVGNGSPFTHSMGLDPEELEQMMDRNANSSDEDDINEVLSGAGKARANPFVPSTLVTSNLSAAASPSDAAKPITSFPPSLDQSRRPFTAEERRELARLASSHAEERILRRYGPPDFPGQTYNYGDPKRTLPDSKGRLIDYRFKVQKKGDELQESVTSRTERMKQQLKKDAEASKKNKEDAKAELKRNMAVLETSRKAKKKNDSSIADGTEGQSMAVPSAGVTSEDEENDDAQAGELECGHNGC